MPTQLPSMDALPGECLTLILKHLPLLEQIRLRIICTRWEAILTKLLATRTSLKLYGSYQQIEDYCRELAFLNIQHLDHLKLKPIGSGRDDDLVVESRCFTREFCDLVLLLFPKLTHLALYITSDIQYPDLEYLAGKLSSQLTVLTFCGYVQPKNVSNLRGRLGKVIEQAKNLERLDFLFKLRLARNVNWDPTEARPFYARTQIHSLDELISPLIGRITSGNFRELNLNWTSNLSVDKILSFAKSKRLKNPEKLEYLRLSAIEEHLKNTVLAFPNLKTLDLEFACWPTLSHLLPDLGKLTNLTELRLAFIQVDMLTQTDEKLANLPELPTVTSLALTEANRFSNYKIGFYDYSPDFDSSQFCSTLAKVFPNLEKLTLRKRTNFAEILQSKFEHDLPLYFGAKLRQFEFHSKFDYHQMFGSYRDRLLIQQERVLGFLN